MKQFWQTDYEVPYWVAGLIVIGVFGSLGFGLLVGNLAGLIAILGGLIRLGVAVFLIYLFYRFVVAVETIAEKH